MIPHTEQINKLLIRFSSNIDKVLEEHHKNSRADWKWDSALGAAIA